MAETGEKYTEARRALGAPPPPGPSASVGIDPGNGDGDPIGWFTDQAYNVILLAEDEARMLGRSHVEPEHLLLAASRSGNVHGLLARWGIDAKVIHAEILGLVGWGDQLVLGRVERGTAAQDALWRAIESALDRGVRSPSSEHLLLGLAAADRVDAVLRAVGISDVVSLVDSRYPWAHPRIGYVDVRRMANVGHRRQAPQPGPMPPVFERFTVEAHAVIDAAVAAARSLKHEQLTPVHILAELLRCHSGVAARARAAHPLPFEAGRARATELLAQHRGASGNAMFTQAARQLIAEDTLAVAHRLGHRPLTTGHLLIALLTPTDDEELVSAQRAFGEVAPIIKEISALLPGHEHP